MFMSDAEIYMYKDVGEIGTGVIQKYMIMRRTLGFLWIYNISRWGRTINLFLNTAKVCFGVNGVHVIVRNHWLQRQEMPSRHLYP